MLNKFYILSQTYIKNYDKPFVRYFSKDIGFEHRLTILIGQRGVGKTTAIIQHILEAYNNDILTKKPCLFRLTIF